MGEMMSSRIRGKVLAVAHEPGSVGALDNSDRIGRALKGIILQLIYFAEAYHRKKREQSPGG